MKTRDVGCPSDGLEIDLLARMELDKPDRLGYGVHGSFKKHGTIVRDAYRGGLTILALALVMTLAGAAPTTTVQQFVSFFLPLASSNFASVKGELNQTNHYDYATYY